MTATPNMNKKLDGLDRPFPPAEQLTREQQLEIWTQYCRLHKRVNTTRWSQRHTVEHLKPQIQEISAEYIKRFRW